MTTIKRVLGLAILGGTVGLVPQLALADVSSEDVPSSQSDIRNRVAGVPDHGEAEARSLDNYGTTEELDRRATNHATVQARGTAENLGAVRTSGIPDHAEAQSRGAE